MDFSRLIRYEPTDRPPVQHGQGAVWQARDLLFSRLVAIKEIRADLQGVPTALRQFKKEAAAGARLGERCPNIVAVYDYGCTNGTLYFVMEWVDGGHLQPLCGNCSLEQAKSIIRQASNGVAIAHENGLVHSDIAPLNILHDTTGTTYKLSDFGYLKILDSVLVSQGSGPLPAGGRRYFMPPAHWMAPEQINESTDIYALALTLHALVTGEALQRRPDGQLVVPRPVIIRQEQRAAPDELRKLLARFIESRSDEDTIVEFREMLDRLP